MKTTRTTIEVEAGATVPGFAFVHAGAELVAHRAYSESWADAWEVTDRATGRRVVSGAKTKAAAIAAALEAR